MNGGVGSGVTAAQADATVIHRALGDRSRVRILRTLRSADRGLDAVELAVSVLLHPNTVRSHLALLERARLVTRRVDRRGGRGRPRVLYASARRLDSDETAAPLLELMDGLGFEPGLEADGDELEVRMHRCPFGITPDAPSAQVCRVHLGLIRGALDELRTPFELERLDVYPEPGYCSLQLRRVPESA